MQATDAAVFSGLSDGEASDGTEQWIVRQLALVQSGEALDTAAYRMTAEIAVTDAVLQPLLGQLDALDEAAPEAETGVTLAVMQAGDEGLQELDSATISAEEAAPVFTVSVQSGTIAVLATTANPSYTVQYYVYIPRFAVSGEKTLNVYNTEGKRLPKNGINNAQKQIFLTPAEGTTTKNAGTRTQNYKVATTDELTQMYTANEFEYIKAPNPSYINKLIDNSSYELKQIWVLQDGKDEASTNEADWTIYDDPANVHFTNRDLKDEDGASAQNIIYLDSTKRNVLRLVYDTKEADFTTSATFYDYNISSGQNGDGKWCTGITGINIESNYPKDNEKTKWSDYRDILAFGNANCGTGMANYKFNGVYLNKYSGRNYGCTFGLAKSLSNGKIVYNDWLITPDLFNEGNANGKKSFENSSLTFSQVGDTYTLSSASVGTRSISGLQDFFNPSPKTDTTHTHIFTNDFWPLDGVSYTDIQMDPKFGSYSNPIYYQGFASADGISGTWGDESKTLPYSDDGQAHNSFFGMQYAVTFTLTPDYVGPLDYTFFGDDDMWVFLDDTLVCDIGGVHSSVGEYVNLWNYIDADRTEDEQHTLTFFYTERGASGSTCYMNFTLPSVSGVNIEQKTGDLEISKQVIGEDDPDKNKEFTFDIKFTDANGSRIWDDYAYTRTKNDGSTETDLVLHNGSQFSLKAGETIRIKYLPIGLRYEITELDPDGYTVTNTVDGVLSGGGSAQGTIIKDIPGTVVFTNTMKKVGLTLQKLDQDGKPLKGAVFELKNAADNPVYAMKDTDSASGQILYTVPSSGANQIQSGALYYIVLAAEPSFVIGQDASAEKHDATLQQKADNGLQKFRVYRQADGSYSFYCEQSQLWLDLDGRGLTNGTLVHFWSNADHPTTEDAQKWYLIANGDGTFKIKPRVAVLAQSKAVLDLNGATIAEGQRIQVWTDNASPAQKWLLVPVEEAAAPKTTKELAVDDGGVLRLAGLLPGSYTLTETKAPGGYQKLSPSISFRVGADGTITLADGTITDAAVENGVLQVRNRHDDLTLTLTKALVNSRTTQSFPFTVSYTADGQTFTQELALANGASGKLQIPYGAEVTITETAHDGFAVTFKSGETLLSSGDSYTFKMTADAAITAVNAAGYALPGTGGGALWLQLAGAALAALAVLAYNWINVKKQKAKGRTRP